MNKIKFDIHVNLGAFPGSRKAKVQRYISPKEMDEYFRTHKITHSLVLYNRDEYDLLKELGEITDTKIYGVQSVMGPTKEEPTDEDNLPELDVNIEGRSFLSGGYCYGVKIASNRGWWIRNEEVTSGLDYSTPVMKRILSQLPKGAIASIHTQGTTKGNPYDGPRMINWLGGKFRDVKFIMNHLGDYGPSLRTARPGIKTGFFKQDGEAYLRWTSHRPVVESGLWICEQSFNIFGDTSCFTYDKAYLVSTRKYEMWTVGSDFPFTEKMCSYTQEREQFKKWVDDLNDNNAVRFFESSMDELLEWSHQRNEKVRLEALDIKKKRRDERKS
jgi:hypothetical protein